MLNLYKQNYKLIMAVTLIIMSGVLTGCSSLGKVLNPYEQEFVACTKGGNEGSCGSLVESHDAAVGKNTQPKDLPAAERAKNNDPKMKTISLVDEAESSYKTATLQKITKLLKDPTTPLVAPPTVLRILILPYQDDENGLNLMRYSYIMLDKPRWIMGDYLNGEH